MNAVETEFPIIIIYYLQFFLWLHFINYIFFIWTHGVEEFVLFLNELSNFHPNLSFTYETLKTNIVFKI